MTKTATGFKRALALALTALMVVSGFAFSASAEGTVTLSANPNQEKNQIEVVPTATGATIKTISYTVTPEPSNAIVTGTDYSCALQGLTKDVEYTISASGTFDDGTSFTAESIKSKVEKYTKDAPAALYATAVTETSVTLNAIAGAEYTIDNWATKHAAGSADANVFSGLTAGQKYTVKARYAEDDDYKTSEAVSCDVTPSNGVTVANASSGSLAVNAVSYPKTGIVVNTNGKTATVTSEPELSVKETGTGEYTLYTTTAGTTYTVTAVSGSDTVSFTIKVLSTDPKTDKEAPTGISVEEITASSIKVTKVDGVEYACIPSTETIKDEDYGTSNEFTGLTENTEYTVYARYAETDESNASAPATIKATPCTSSITCTPNTANNSVKVEVVYPASDSVKSTTITPTGTPAASVANEKSGTGTYTCDIFNIVPGTKYTVTVTLTSGKTLTKTVLIKSTQEAPAAPTFSSRTKNSIVINSVKGTEYICVAHGTVVPTEGWTTATATTLTFNNLTDGTVYDIYARLPETETANVSSASKALSVTTIKASTNEAPEAVTFTNVSKTEVIFTKLSGYEYKLYIDGNESSAKWQDSNKFTGLTADTTYYAVQRVKVDETVQEVNPTSAPKKVKTNSGDPYIITEASLSTFTLSTDNGSYTITATAAKKSTTDKQWGDIKIVPDSYTIKKGDTVVAEGQKFKTTDEKTYTASGSVSDAGDYTVVVIYKVWQYQNEGTDDGFVTKSYATQQKTFTVVAKWQYYLQKALSFLGTTLPQYMMKGFDWLRKNSSGISSFISILLGSSTTAV